jgi:uncharacterized protein YjbI with pentapeptide repeats
MSASTPNLRSSKPIATLQKEVTIDLGHLLKAVASAIGHTALGKWEKLGDDAADTLYAIGVQTDPGELASLLVRRALAKAIFELVGDSAAAHMQKSDEPHLVMLKIEADESLYSFDVDRTFLERPASLRVVNTACHVLENWLKGSGLSTSAASAVSSRLPTYFTYALNQEWRRNSKSYQPLIASLGTPFSQAGEREWAWASYVALLNRRIQESVLDEPFSLEQIYIPLNCYYLSEGRVEASEDDLSRFEGGQIRVVVSLEEELLKWIERGDQYDSVRVISGGPGSGKSSFAKVFAARLAERAGLRVLFIPLHLIDPSKNLEDEIARFVRDEGVLAHNPLDPASPEPNLLVILDGLDELATQGKAAAETARAFVREIERTVQKRNSAGTRLRVLLSGRELVVQENDSEFRQPGQVLTLLPYYVNVRHRGGGRVGEHSEGTFTDRGHLLQKDLRNDWWLNYGRLTGKNYARLPDELSRHDLDDVTTQPLLNYLVALSLTRGKLDFSTSINLNVIYSDLVAAVYERGYERRRAYTSIRHMRRDDFTRVLEEIALAAWHGDGRSTSVREIEQHCDVSGVAQLLERFKEGAEAGITRLLAAFFFRQHGRRPSGDQTFVFTHKSFGEYLAARRVVRATRRVVKELAKRLESADEGWDQREALRHWTQICGPSEMTTYLARYFFDEVALVGAEELRTWQTALAELFTHVLKHGLPLEGLHASNMRDALFKSRNAEESLLVALNACARVTREISLLEHEDPTAFGAWLRRIQGQRTSPESAFALQCLSYLNLQGVHLDICDLYGANFEASDLSDARAHGACLILANLKGARLTNAVFSWANAERANLSGSDARGAFFIETNLTDAIMEGVRLDDAQVVDARLVRVQPPPTRKKLAALSKEQKELIAQGGKQRVPPPRHAVKQMRSVRPRT